MEDRGGEYLTYEEVARIIGPPCSKDTVWRWAKQGRIAVTRFGPRKHRISRQALRAYLESVTTPTTQGK